jgi:hypothetical protein
MNNAVFMMLFLLDAKRSNGLVERQAIAYQLNKKTLNIVRSNAVLCPDRLIILNFGNCR